MRFLAIFLLALGLTTVSPATAQDTDYFAADPCRRDNAACHALAVEVAKRDMQDFLMRAISVERGSSALCPPDNPNCCPPKLAPVCGQIAQARVDVAHRSYQAAALGEEKCPYGSLCDTLNTLLCGPDGSYLGDGRCSYSEIEIPDFCPPGFKKENGVCVPIICEPGFEPNSKGVCIPKKCTFRGYVVPCGVIDALELQRAVDGVRLPRTPLARRLADPDVQGQALSELREELNVALENVEAAMKALDAVDTAN